MVMEEFGHNNDEILLQGQDRNMIRNGGGGSSNRTYVNGPPHIELIPTRKSNLKKPSSIVDQENQTLKTAEKRKVSWPDAHGKDMAHVQEFEPSVSDDGELEGVRNSCVCSIQ
ncbi:hypothetical protein COLO4_20307 [Corchorus olitorius]|uniref:Uncharacterized protein n=1 Tax=Corchorus olitorius TaxID=93759 RepID=A0A1R3J0F5_9ROSI|nr:hypothetical protein COLO4_20307 [Corchorus olitorius]